MTDLKECGSLGLCMTSSCCIRRSYAAVPHSILRDAIGTFHTGKSADPSRKVSLPGNFPHREELRRCPLHTLEGRHRAFSHWEARQSLQQGDALCQFLQPGDATLELPRQDRDAVCSTNSGYHSYTQYPLPSTQYYPTLPRTYHTLLRRSTINSQDKTAWSKLQC